MRTVFKTKEEAKASRKWHLVDAKDVTLGRLASEIAVLLRGKHKPEFSGHNDCGDFVIVVNAEQVRLTGKKLDQKVYYHHTGYVGGIKGIGARRMMEDHPDRIISKAVKGMLPKGALSHQQIKKLKVYAGEEHPHVAQQPQPYSFRHARGQE